MVLLPTYKLFLTEKVSKKHLMGAYHGGWSLGGFAGAGVLLVLLKILSLPVNESILGPSYHSLCCDGRS